MLSTVFHLLPSLTLNQSIGNFNFFILISAKPGMLDLKAKYKWESWDKKKGMTKEQAMEKYIEKANEVIAKCS